MEIDKRMYPILDIDALQLEMVLTVARLNEIMHVATRKAKENRPDRDKYADLVEYLNNNEWRSKEWK